MISKKLAWRVGGCAATALAASSALGQVDHPVPLNYNWHAMAKAGEGYVSSTAPNADSSTNLFRSFADRGYWFSTTDPNSVGGAPLVGTTGIQYSLFNTLGYGNTTWPNAAGAGYDSVVLANRVLNASLEILPGNATNSGPFPSWSPAVNISSFAASAGLAATSPGVVTAATASAHNFRAGDIVLVGGAIPSLFNGTYTIIATPDATHFTYVDPTGNVTGTPQMFANNISVSGTAISGTTLTVTCSTAHGLAVGQNVTLSGMNAAAGVNTTAYNGTFPVVSIGAQTPPNTFTVTVGTGAGNGTARMFYNSGAGNFQISALTSNTTTVTVTAGGSATTTATGLVGNGTAVTATTTAAHPFSVGEQVLITGAVPATFNGTYTVATVPTTTTFTFASGVSGSSTTAGTVTEVHGLSSGQNVAISGVSPIALNGSYTVTVPSASLSGIVSTTTTAAATTATAHPFSNGQNVTISGASVPAHNGTFAITVPSATIAYLSGNGTTVTATTSAANTFVNGQLVSISGSYPAAYNGTYAITVVDATHFTYSSAATGAFYGASTGVTATSASTFTYTIPSTAGTSAAASAMTPSVFTYSLVPQGAMLVRPTTGFQGFGYALSSLQGNGTAVTGQTASAHNLVAGQSITISNVLPASYNGTYTVASVPSTTTFTYADATNTAATTGTFMGAGTLDRASTDQVTTLSTPISVDPTSQVGVLYTVSNGPNIPFDCVLTFNNGGADTNITARFTPPDWFGSTGNAADQAVLAGQPIASQTKVLHPVNYGVFGLQGDGTTVTADLAMPHGFVVNDVVAISGANPAYNGTYTIASVGTASATIAIGGLSGDGTTVTATVSTNAFVTGQAVYITGVFPYTFNGVYNITVIDTTHFTFANPTVGTNTVAGGAARTFFTALGAGTGVFTGNAVATRSTGTNNTFRGVQNTDAAQFQNFNTTNAGPNLNLTEGIVGLNASIAGLQLKKVTFKNATWTNFIVNSGIVANGTYALATTSAAHGLIPGQTINITGVTPASFNGIYQVGSVPSTTTLTFAYAGGSNSTAAGTLQRVGSGRGYSIYAVTARTGIPTPANGSPATAAVANAGVGAAGDNAGTLAAAYDGFTTTTGGGIDSYGVWYRYTATGGAPHMVEARTCLDGQNPSLTPEPLRTGVTGVRTVAQANATPVLPLDTTIAIYSGTAGAPVFVAGNDNGCNLSSRVQWLATPGTQYFIRVAVKSPVAGNSSLFIMHVDDPIHTDLTMPLQFNWNGICHGTAASAGPNFFSEQCVNTPQVHENRSDLNGFRSISDRGLLFDPNNATTNAFNYGGTVGYQGMQYTVYATPLQSDLVHLGTRTSAGFQPTTTTWADPVLTPNPSNGYLPLWLPGDTASGTAAYDHNQWNSSMTGLNATFGDTTKLGLIYHMTNVSSTAGFASFNITLTFADSSSFVVTVNGTDWYAGSADAPPYNQTMPAAPPAGVEAHRVLGIYNAVQNFDRGDAAANGTLRVCESVISTSSLTAAGFDPRGRGILTDISFGGINSLNATTNVAVFAATLRDPASFNLNFGPSGVGTVSPNMLTVGANGLMTVSVSRGSGSPNNITTVTVDGSSLGLSNAIALNDSHLSGDVSAGDNIWSSNVGFPVNSTPGAFSLPFTVTDAQNRTSTGNIIFTLVGPTGSATPNPVNAGSATLLRVVLSPTTGGPADIASVVVDGSAVGLSGSVPLNDSGTGGDAVNHDGIWSATVTIPPGAVGQTASLPVTITDISARSAVGAISLTVIGPPAATDLGTLGNGLNTQTSSIDTAGQVKWFKFTLTAPIDVALSSFLDIDTEGSFLSPTNDIFIGLYDSNGVLITADDDDGSAAQSQLTYGAVCPARPAVGDGLSYNGRDGAVLPAGTYYLAYTSFTATFGAGWNVVSTSANVGSVTININKGQINTGGGAPAATNLGNVTASTTPTVINGTGNISAGGVAWFKFTLTADVDGAVPTFKYIDLDTEGSAVGDTVMALFRDDGSGTLVNTDEDEGSGLYSQMSYGRGTRPPVADGVAYNGRDGILLTAGTYYVAVAEHPAGVCNNFVVAFTTGTSAGGVNLNIHAGVQNPILAGPIVNPDNGHSYYLLDSGFTWPQAEAFAVSQLSGHLAQVQDNAENDFIRFFVVPAFDNLNHNAFIGLWDSSLSTTPAGATYVWTTGEPVTFTSWAPGEPNVAGGLEHYAEMNSVNGLWNDQDDLGTGDRTDFSVIEVGGGGVCCRGATCNTTVGQAGCTVASGTAGAAFVAGNACNTGAVSNTPCCYANYNKANGISVQDIFDFLGDWFAGSPYANVGGTGAAGTLSVQNIFDFLSDWFNGGCS